MRRYGWGLILLLVMSGGIMPAGNSHGQDTNVSERIYFSALNKEEKPVMGLKPADFELRIDGKPAPLVSFHPAASPGDRSIPYAVLILLSFGPTMKSKVIEQQANAAAGLFQMLNPASVVGIRMVSDRSEALAPLAHDPQALKNALLQYEQRRAELNVGLKKDEAIVGNAGMVRALEFAVDEIDDYIASQPSLRGREVRRAIMVISGAEVNPGYSLRTLYEKAARASVFLYPVYYPIGLYGPFVMDYFQLAKRTAGVASVFGALKPGSEVLPLPRSNLNPNALTTNFLHMIRDVNGKYSFTVAAGGRGTRLELKCKIKGVQIRLPRTSLEK
jgi:hypothetical protein